MVLAVPITGSEVPDSVYLCVRDQRNISTKRGSPAYLGLSVVKRASMSASTQGDTLSKIPGRRRLPMLQTYATPIKVQLELNAQLAAGANLFVVG